MNKHVVTAPTGVRVTVPVADFGAAVSSVLPFVGPAELPAIAVVRLELAGPRGLDVVATDRYRLGWYRLRPAGSSAESQATRGGVWIGGVSVDAHLARRVLALLGYTGRGRRRDTRELSMTTLPGARVRFEVPICPSGPEVVSVEVPTYTGAAFPDWRTLLAGLRPAQPTAGLSVNPRLLADFAKVANPHRDPMRVSFHRPLTSGAPGDGPIRLDVGEVFTALLMPFRMLPDAPAKGAAA